ncbi:MAG: hypothetical protein RL523_378 [Actinomycetota bacterium]
MFLSNLNCMGKPSLILAALAADALPGLRFVQVQDVSEPNADIVTELLITDQGQQVLLKSPKSSLALTRLGLEVRALRVLKNVNLPFRVPALLGETSPGAVYKALAFDYVTGRPVALHNLKMEDPLVTSLGSTLAQIHSIPTSLVIDAGLPEYDPMLKVRERVAEFDRAMETGKIHRDLLERWQNALLDVNLFRYQPTVVHGSLSSQVILAESGEVVGINNWTELSVDDPAVDLAAIYADCSPEVADAVALAYETLVRADRNIRQRANLYFELSLANYLLHLVTHGSESEIAGATKDLESLHADLLEGRLYSLSPTEIAPSNPEVVTPISQAASFTSPVTIVTEQIEVIELPEAGEPDSEKN